MSKRRQEAEVLAAIRAGHRSGFAIGRAAKLHAGRVYATLFRLERDGRVTSDWEWPAPAGRPPRRLYDVASEDR